jgi:hypothetical protein
MLLSPSSRSFSSYFLRHLHPASAIFFILLLAGRGSGLSFRIPCLLCRLMKALVSFVDACVDSTLTYQNIGSVALMGVIFGCCRLGGMLRKALSSSKDSLCYAIRPFSG